MTYAQESPITRFIKPDPGSHQRKGDWVLSCSSCGKQTSVKGGLGDADSWLSQRFRNQGWKVDAKFKSCKCPTCKNPRAGKQGNGKMPKTSGSAAMASVRALRLIEDNFDKDAGRYLNGQSDGLIAGTVGLDIHVVTEIREEEFGPIKGDPELLRVKEEMIQLERECSKEIGAAVELIKATEAAFRKRHAALQVRLEDLGDKIG